MGLVIQIIGASNPSSVIVMANGAIINVLVNPSVGVYKNVTHFMSLNVIMIYGLTLINRQ